MNEASLLEFALSSTAARVEERCQQLRNAGPGAVNRAHERRSVRVCAPAPEGGDTARGTLSVELPIETGERVCRALDQAVEAGGQQGAEFEAESWSAEQADALVTMVKHYLNGGSEGSASTADAYQVVVHVDSAALHGGEGRSDLAVESVKRLSCDGSVVPMVDGANGEPLNVGRKQRTVPAALKRALWAAPVPGGEDGGCSFPGLYACPRTGAHALRGCAPHPPLGRWRRDEPGQHHAVVRRASPPGS